MWLLDTENGNLVQANGRSRYAILSHVWSPGGEQSFQDTFHCLRSEGLSAFSDKVRGSCTFARRNGYRKLWVDSCCIDKTSSAEQSEAINSMFLWYTQAHLCLVYLDDVEASDDPRAPGSMFRRSRWFTRGWTLQELIAPRFVLFVSRDWRPLGTKTSLVDVIEEVTGIDRAILLLQQSLHSISVARRMSWAAHRTTTRIEDEAYSLLGIFDIHMPTLYGEGRHAFIRLQEEILKRIPDQSIFLWGRISRDPVMLSGTAHSYPFSTHQSRTMGMLLAPSPKAFADIPSTASVPFEAVARFAQQSTSLPEFAVTSHGIRAKFLIMTCESSRRSTHFALLPCVDLTGAFFALLLRPDTSHALSQDRFLVGDWTVGGPIRLTCFSEADLVERLQSEQVSVEAREIYLPYRSSATQCLGDWLDCDDFRCPCSIIIPDWVQAKLEKEGYVITNTQMQGGMIHVIPEQKSCTMLLLMPVNEHDSEAHSVIIVLCETSDFSPSSSLQAWVTYVGMSPDAYWALLRPDALVQDWKNHSKDFSLPGLCVRLEFTPWDNHTYALNIDISSLPLHDSHDFNRPAAVTAL